MISPMRKNNFTLAIISLIVMTDIGESIAQTLMKAGLNKTGMTDITLGNLAEFAFRSATSAYVWLGVFVFLINFFIWITILSRIDLSIAHPVGSSSYIFVPLLSLVFLHEAVSPLRWMGIVLIIAGIHFVVKSTETETMPL